MQLAIEDAVEAICADPGIGEMKVAGLAGTRVYKFKFNRQGYLVAYHLRAEALGKKVEAAEFLTIDFYQVGTHENFYASLKCYLREGGMEP